MAKIKTSEADVLKAIIRYLTLKKILFIRNNTGALSGERNGRSFFVRFGSPGSPDILMFYNGTTYGIECKSSTGVQSQAQFEFQQRFEAERMTYILARSVDDVMRVIE